jgi:hypothetical protein
MAKSNNPNENKLLARILHKAPDFHKNRLMLLIANSLAGKTTVVQQYIHDTMKGPHPRYKKILLLCPTHHMSRSYDMLPDEWKFKDFEIAGFYRRLQEVQERKRDPETKEVPESERVLLILDDCIGTVSGRDNTLQEIAGKARHYKIDVIVVSQHTSGLACPIVRSNTTFTMLGLMQDTNREKVVKTLASLGSKKEAIDYVNKVFSDPYRFIVLSNHPEDEMPLYTYKVNRDKIPAGFKIRLKPRQVDEDIQQLQPPEQK